MQLLDRIVRHDQRSFLPARTANGQVAGTAAAMVPMVVTSMFGMTPRTIDIEGEARFEIGTPM